MGRVYTLTISKARKDNKMELVNAKANIKKVEEFAKYLKSNFNEHSKNIKKIHNLSDMENSVALLKDYSKVANELVAIIDEYCKETGLEF